MSGGRCCCSCFLLLFQNVERGVWGIERYCFGGGDGGGGRREFVAAFWEGGGLTETGLDPGEFEKRAGETELGVVVGAGKHDGWRGGFHHCGLLLLLAGGFPEGGGDGRGPRGVEKGGAEGEDAATEEGEGVRRAG